MGALENRGDFLKKSLQVGGLVFGYSFLTSPGRAADIGKSSFFSNFQFCNFFILLKLVCMLTRGEAAFWGKGRVVLSYVI